MISVQVLAGRYYDSVRLMQVSREAAAVAGVEQVLVAMATDLNLRLLEEMGFTPESAAGAGPDDLLIALRAVDEAAGEAGLAAIERALVGSFGGGPAGLFAPPAPRTVGRAGRAMGANLALISVPGPHAFVEAMDALAAGLHVLVFSNNVSIDQEILLKQTAAERGLLVMGPDCGTSIVGGAGLGFANAVEPGPVAITGASGTGIQEVCCLLDAAGVGVRHALGTGSRDLSGPVGGSATRRALAALDADPAVEVIVVVSKPPDPAVAVDLENAVAGCRTPVVLALLGTQDVTLEGAARQVLDRLRVTVPPWPEWHPQPAPPARPGALRGVFSGGTLGDEARAIVAEALGAVSTEPDAPGHRVVDYGADRFTRGRAHPMIDPALRLEELAAAAADPATGSILLDVVLGHGAHPDPATEFAPLISTAVEGAVAVIVSLCGARRDPQGRDRQAAMLCDAGAEVYLSNAAAARRAAVLAGVGR